MTDAILSTETVQVLAAGIPPRQFATLTVQVLYRAPTIYDGVVALTATSTLTSDAGAGQASFLTASSTLTAGGSRTAVSTVPLSTVFTLISTFDKLGAAALAIVSTLTPGATTFHILSGGAALSSVSSLTSAATTVTPTFGVVALSASGTLVAAGLIGPIFANTGGSFVFGAGSSEATFDRQPTIVSDDPIVVAVTFLATADVVPTSASLPSSLDLRVAAGVTVTPTIPAFVLGKPLVPDYWAKTDSSMTASGAGGLLMVPDPDPVLGNPDPGGLAPTYTWHVTDLSSSPVSDWPPHGGSGPHWQSAGGFQPILRQTVVYGPHDRYHTYTKGVHFDGADVQHMWMDWGSNLSQPFTVVMCAIIHYYPTRRYGHYLLDAGKAQSTGLADGNDHTVNDAQNHRNVMLYQHHNAVLATHQGADAVRNGKHVITRADFAPRPKMFFGIFNGTSSYIGAWDNRNKYLKKGTVDAKTHRQFVMGRRQNNISDNLASHMTMFEIRMFNSAVSIPVLREIYKQLAATWKFNQYHV